MYLSERLAKKTHERVGICTAFLLSVGGVLR